MPGVSFPCCLFSSLCIFCLLPLLLS
jgi:hypothetical protein